MDSASSLLTPQLAMLIGLYELAAGIAGLSGRLVWADLIDGFDRSPALTFVTGLVAFAIGGAMVMAHNLWAGPLAIIVSLIAWAALVEGLLLIAWPQPIMAMSRPLVRNQRAISLAAALFGAAMLAAGLYAFVDSLVFIKVM